MINVKMNLMPLLFAFLCFILTRVSPTIASSSDEERQVYIVYMGEIQKERETLMDAHHSLLLEAIGDEKIARESRIHSYGRSFNGFVARLLPHEAKFLSQKEGVVSVFRNRVQKLLTTRSWDFVGMPLTLRRNLGFESSIIVAILDTGVWPENPMFSDEGFGPPPRKWKGTCDKGVNFTGCNNKVIGAQFFDVGQTVLPNETTPVDNSGHGTHTASTAAGVAVVGASLYGIAGGTARGGAPAARIASYKVCWGVGCEDANLLAGFDAAIDDGVDIISVSIGGYARSLTQDPIAIGSFHAAKRGILTVCAGGNDGPDMATVQNVAPWIFTVAATTTNRKLVTDVKLGNGEIISGMSINTFATPKGFLPLISGAQAGNFSGSFYGNASACDVGTLSRDKVKGKIVFCLGSGGDSVVNELGGVGTILSNELYPETAMPTVAAGAYVNIKDGERIRMYINSTLSPKAIIFKTRSINVAGPAIATYSGRGPQMICPNLLKPDIAAPGVNILAAYTKYSTVTKEPGDKRVVKYNIQSGTSMACPHVAGAAAFVKSFHPRWSSAAIKSALMTTATRMKVEAEGAELASGSGEMQPTTALHPGLIYDMDTTSYVAYLCKIGYQDNDIALLMGDRKLNCSNVPQQKGTDGLNYPSMHVLVKDIKSNISATFYREVTNVGFGKSVYVAKVTPPKGLSITVVPDVLTFAKPYEKKSFKVIVEGKFIGKKSWYLSGSLVWSDSRHHARSPILVSVGASY